MSNGQQAGAVIGGIIGGVVGAFAGNPALGFSIGWTAGSWVGGALDPPKEQITDFGAQAFPPFNTSVRGATIPVLFGTNRVPSQIVYQGGYETIRSVQSGSTGGKGGGSGAGGKGPPPQGQAAYEYKLDIIYHFGMTPEPVSLLNAWMGAEKLSSSTMQSINNYGGSGGGITAFFEKGATNPAGRQGLTFNSARFYAGDPSEDTAWTPLVSETGIDARWPNTTWVGFEGLSLGNNPVIPQLSWEIGASQNVVNLSGSLDWVTDVTSVDGSSMTTNSIIPGGPDDWGYTWVVSSRGSLLGGRLAAINTATGAIANSYALADLIPSWIAETLAVFTPVTGQGGCSMFLVKGSKLLCMSTVSDASANHYHCWLVADINSDGTLSPSGGCYARHTGLANRINWSGAGIFEKPDGNGFVCIANHYFNACVVLHGPTLSQMEDFFAGSRINLAWAYLSGDSDHLEFGMTGEWFLPFYTPGEYFGCLLPDLSGAYKFSVYCSPKIYYPEDSVGARNSFTSNLPNGGIISFLIAPMSVGHYIGSPDQSIQASYNYGPTFDTGVFADGGDGTSLEDDGKNFTVDTDGPNGYSPSMFIRKEDECVYLVAFYALINADPSYYPATGKPWYMRLRVYVWDLLSGTFNLYVAASGAPFIISNFPDYGGGLGDTGRGIHSLQLKVDDEENISAVFNTSTYITDQIPSGRIGRIQYGQFAQTGTDVTPPYIIRQILVNEVFGIYAGRFIVDEASYATAVAYCESNNFYVSTQYRNDGQAQQWIERLLSIYDGFVTVDVTAGLIKFGVTELNNTSVRVIDNQHLLRKDNNKPPVNTTKGARQDTYNLIKINYLDRDIDYKQNQVEEGDEVDQDITGVRMREFPPDFVMSQYVARRMANRALWSNLYTRDTHQFHLGWKDADLEPGDVITLVDSFTNLNQVVRISRWKEIERGIFEVGASQLLQYIPTVSYVESSFWQGIDWAGVNSSYTSQSMISSGFTRSGAPNLYRAAAYELPYEFSSDGNGRVYVGWVPNALAAGANLYVSADGESFGLADSVVPYPLYGQLLHSLPAWSSFEPQTNVEISILSTSYHVSSGPVIHTNGTMNDVGLAAMHSGVGLFWVGSEMVAYTGVTLIGQNRYQLSKVYRGWGGTPIGAHNSFSLFWQPGGGIFSREYTPDQIGRTLIYKVVPLGFDGREYSIASIAAQSYTILGTHYRPGMPSALDYAGNRGVTRLSVGSTVDVPITWKRSARQSGFGFGGAGTNPGGYGDFTTDVSTLGWRVNVVGSGGLNVRSAYVSTPEFTYTSSMNAADNGAWHGAPAIRVTPRNQFGDALATSVISMELFA